MEVWPMTENNPLNKQPPTSNFSPQSVLDRARSVVKFTRDLIWVPPQDLYGEAYVTPELKSDARLAALVLSLANILDACLSQEILVAAAGPIFGTCINGGLLVAKNSLGTLVVRKREGSRGTRIVCLCAFSSLNLISCLVSGTGTEMMLNKSGIAQVKAQQIYLDAENNTKRFQAPSKAKAEEAQKECDKAEKDYQSKTYLPEFHPTRDAAWVKAYGMTRERSKKWDLNEGGIPLCVKSQMLGDRVKEEEQQFKLALEWDKKLLKRSQISNDLIFIKQEFPNQFDLYFDNNGNFKSGVEAFATANYSFFGKLSKGDLAGISLSLLLAGISISTSIAACFLVVTFANNLDAQKSWSESVKRERDRRLHERQKLKGNNP